MKFAELLGRQWSLVLARVQVEVIASDVAPGFTFPVSTARLDYTADRDQFIAPPG
jgi:hypothetical protein